MTEQEKNIILLIAELEIAIHALKQVENRMRKAKQNISLEAKVMHALKEMRKLKTYYED